MTMASPDLPPVPPPDARSPEECQQIASLLTKHLPLHSDLAGASNVADVARGARFLAAADGHHIELTMVLSTLSAVASLVHYGMILVHWLGQSSAPPPAEGAPEPLRASPNIQWIEQEIRRRFSTEPRITELMAEDPTLLERILTDVYVQASPTGGGEESNPG